MVWNKKGFLVPEVDTAACVKCGLCAKQCLALAAPLSHTDNINSVVSYGGWNRNQQIHHQSSSGGIFSALAEKTIKQNGVVYGVVWRDKYSAVFDRAESIDDIKGMRGSKYTPAIPGNVYRDVLKDLKNNRLVLFSGTPCQVHALRKYIRKDYDDLLTVDIVCHGAPSHLILEKYINEDESRTGKEIHHISFRDKPEGWKKFHVMRHYTDNTVDSASLNDDIYMKLFLSDMALNKACYNCPYAHIPRQGDITLGDYWGVENYHDDWPIEEGISAVLANSPKGKTWLSELRGELDLREEQFHNIYNGQDVVYIRPSSLIPSDRTIVLDKLASHPLGVVYQKYVNTIRVGVFRINKQTRAYTIISKIKRFRKRLARWLKSKM